MAGNGTVVAANVEDRRVGEDGGGEVEEARIDYVRGWVGASVPGGARVALVVSVSGHLGFFGFRVAGESLMCQDLVAFEMLGFFFLFFSNITWRE